MTLGRVKGSQNDRFSFRVFQKRIFVCFEQSIHKGIAFFPFIKSFQILSTFCRSIIIVCEFTFNVILFRICEKFNCVLSIGKPRMVQYFLDSESFCRFFLQQASQEISSLFWYTLLQFVVGLDNHFLQFAHIVGPERHNTVEHRVQDNPTRPYVTAESFVAFVFQNFRGDICRSATLFVHYFTSTDHFRNTKITNFDLSLCRQQNVVKFDVSMKNWLWMAIGKSVD